MERFARLHRNEKGLNEYNMSFSSIHNHLSPVVFVSFCNIIFRKKFVCVCLYVPKSNADGSDLGAEIFKFISTSGLGNLRVNKAYVMNDGLFLLNTFILNGKRRR